MQFAGRTALVTGGANGIGRAIVSRFVAGGARVALVDREQASDLDDSVTAFRFDLAETERLETLVEEIEATVGPLDVLVNNAGIFEPALAVDLPLESYRRVLAVNLDAPVFLARTAARSMIGRGYGRIVNITSIHGQFGEETALSYDVAKSGLNQATRTLAIELGPHGILVNSVSPGLIDTGFDPLSEEVKRAHAASLPLMRLGQPDDLVGAFVFLASDDSRYFCGQTLHPNGGEIMP